MQMEALSCIWSGTKRQAPHEYSEHCNEQMNTLSGLYGVLRDVGQIRSVYTVVVRPRQFTQLCLPVVVARAVFFPSQGKDWHQ